MDFYSIFATFLNRNGLVKLQNGGEGRRKRLKERLILCWQKLKFSFYVYSQGAGNIPNFCEVGLKISGSIPIVQTAAIQFQDTLLTSIALAATEQHTVAFVGTSTGIIRKVKYTNFRLLHRLLLYFSPCSKYTFIRINIHTYT